MTPNEFIRTKRNGLRHTQAEIRWFVEALTSKSIEDYQVTAWLMAAYLNGLDSEESAALTLAITDSGERLKFESLGDVADKHSTGGVGDAVTPLFIPIVAACGVPVVKMSGRGLGFTGGTLDKLESIPGFSGDLSPEALVAQAMRIGCAWGGQTADLAPADKILYALRDATETVDSLQLIAASIMSKKLAAGGSVLVLDVKCGNGAFMQTHAESLLLAEEMVSIGRAAGKRVRAFVTDMSQPLATAVGNALEVRAALNELRSGMKGRLGRVVMALAQAACDEAGAGRTPREVVDSGAAEDKLREWIAAQGGDAAVVDEVSVLPSAPVTQTVLAGGSGFLGTFDCRTIGEVARSLGAGRHRVDDVIEPSVGIEVHVELGASVRPDEPIYTIHAMTQEAALDAAGPLADSFTLSEQAPEVPALITPLL